MTPERTSATETDSDSATIDETAVSEHERLTGELATLEAENERLRNEYARLRRTQHRQTAIALVVTGLLAAVGGFLLPSARTVLFALGGTGVFLGVLTYYLAPEQFLPASVGRDVYETFARNSDDIVGELGLSDARYYVPLGERPDVRLYVPQSAASDLPAEPSLRETFVVDEERRGVAVHPSGEALFGEFEQAVTGGLATTPADLAAQLGDALVEQFELVESTEQSVPADATREAGELTVGVTESVYGPLGQFDHPVVSFLAVGLARGLDSPVAVSVGDGSDRVDAAVTCRWPANTAGERTASGETVRT